MERALYTEINLFCVLILVILMVAVWRNVVRELDKRFFFGLCFHSLLLFFLDLMWKLCDGSQFAGALTVNKVINAAYFIQTGVLGFVWLRYSYYLENGDADRGIKPVLQAIPVFVLAVLSIASIWTGWIFSVDEMNCYHRGPYLALQVVLACSFLAAVFVRTVFKALQKKNFARRGKLLAIAGLGFVPLAGEVIQIMVPGTVVFCVGVTFGLFVMFVENQNQLISLDALTKLNNRNQLNYFLDEKINHYNANKLLMLFVLDVDQFRDVNAKFGHMQGDLALVMIAEVLRAVFGPMGHFISRSGGDEFVAVAELNDLVEAYELRTLFNKILASREAELPYKFTVSMGFAERKEGDDNIPDLFKRAELELEKVKRDKRSFR